MYLKPHFLFYLGVLSALQSCLQDKKGREAEELKNQEKTKDPGGGGLQKKPKKSRFSFPPQQVVGVERVLRELCLAQGHLASFRWRRSGKSRLLLQIIICHS